MSTFLITGNKSDCTGCCACQQVCPFGAIKMVMDNEQFLYPVIDDEQCRHCNKCVTVCPEENPIEKNQFKQFVWGGSNKSKDVLKKSTSGGAFTALVDAWFTENSIIFGAVEVSPTSIKHQQIDNKNDLDIFRKSKYLQSEIGDSYYKVKQYLAENKRVLFSGTPCQIAGLYAILGNKRNDENLLTVEVMCEGVPTPKYISKYIDELEIEHNKKVDYLDWRDKNKSHWDFEFMKIIFDDSEEYQIARWFNPFWDIWLKHLMSRPSCYECQYTTVKRVADITLADLWGVHLFCPELYSKNAGASLVLCNSSKGKKYWLSATKGMNGHELSIDDVVKYQAPMRNSISKNNKRTAFMNDLDTMSYKEIVNKWYDKPTAKLIFSKYIYGNRQKVFLWNLKNKKRVL